MPELTDQQLQEHRDQLRHSAAHILAEAVLQLYPGTKLTIGPPIENGFYYDFDSPHTFTPEDLRKLEKVMKRSIQANTEFVEREVTRQEALEFVKDNQYKQEIIEGIGQDETLTIVAHSNGAFEDLCRGGHLHATGGVKAFKLMSIAGAYWRGDESRPMLQRIYGTAWESKQLLEEHLKLLEEAERRDHRRLGNEQHLFFFSPLAPAMPFFLPQGTILVNRITDYLRQKYRQHGYQEIITPQIFSVDLWKTSGHYDNYAENMFFIDADDREYGVKPMNCPAAMLAYKWQLHSYRDLPLRLADLGRVHRYERSGVVHGLTRVRGFCQDDAHIFCTQDQIAQEVAGCLDMLEEIYADFALNRPEYTLSLRPAKKIGSEELWDAAESALAEALNKRGANFQSIPEEGAFYGPKIDIFLPDALGRKWQLGTVQLDFALPERFQVEYITPEGEHKTPVVIHRALIGSVERFLGVYLEDKAGHLPLWLAPTQAVAIPIADRHNEYALELAEELKAAGISAAVDISNERMGYKIRAAQKRRIPYMLIVGDQEMEARKPTVRDAQGRNAPLLDTQQIIDLLNEEIGTKGAGGMRTQFKDAPAE